MADVPAVGLPAAVVIRLLTVAATVALAGRARACRWTALAGSIAASMLTMTVALMVITSGRPVTGLLGRHAASGIVFDYMVTPLSAWFLMVLGLIAIPIAVYSVAVPMTAGALGMAPGLGVFDRVVPGTFAMAVLGALLVAGLVTAFRRAAVRRAPTCACGGALTAQTEYTATAFSKPLLMIFEGVYRPTRQIEAVTEVSPYFPHEVRYREHIEPTFERYLYAPLVRVILRGANGMRVLQAGSLHTYLAYVLVLAVILLVWLGGTT